MFKKFALLTALVLVLAPVSAALATKYWDNGQADSLSWGDAANWMTDGVPGSGDVVYLRGLVSPSTGNQTEVDVDNAVCAGMCIAINSGSTPPTTDHWLTITGDGVLTVTSYIQNSVGVADPYAEITVNGGTLRVGSTGYFAMTWPNGNPATQEMANVGVLNMNSGLIDTGYSGSYAYGFAVSRNAVGNHHGEVYLYGGDIYCGGFYMGFHSVEPPAEEWVANTQSDYMDITYGVLWIKGDREEQIQGYIDSGYIEAFGGDGVVVIETGVDVTWGPVAGNGEYTKVYGIIPEPGTMLLAGFGVLLLLVTKRKR